MMRNLATAAAALALAGAFVLSGCTTNEDPAPKPPPSTQQAPSPTPEVAPPPPEPAAAPPGTTTQAPTTTTKKKATARPAPTIGAQCRDGDEKKYSVCAGHKEWTNGQVEYAQCTNSGGTWSIQAQKCTYPARTKAPSPDSVHSSDPNYRDANGETKAEYCARTGQPLSTCQAG